MNQILELLPKSRQNLLFSATLSDKIAEIQDIVLNNPIVVKIEQKEETVSLIDQTGYFVSEEKKGPLLRHLIENGDWKQVLIFTSSTYKADNVADKLRKNGFSASAIHSKKSQGARTSALAQFKNGEVKILVTTDLLARGIDISFLPFVINIGLMIYYGVTNRAQVTFGILTGFGIVLFLVVCLSLLFPVACLLMLGFNTQ